MMTKINTLVAKFNRKQDGVTALEYALIAALIAVAIIVAVRGAGTATSATFESVTAAMPN